MLDNQQQGALSWVERVRLERANGLREEDKCGCNCGCSPYDEDHLIGMTYADAVKLPIRQNAVCPHTKVIVPVVPAFLVEEKPKVHTIEYPTAPYRVVDMNPCDGRTGVLKAIPHGMDTEVQHASTTVVHTTKVVDNLFDSPNVVNTVETKIIKEGDVEQPLKVGETELVNAITPDGKTAEKLASNPEAKKKGKAQQ